MISRYFSLTYRKLVSTLQLEDTMKKISLLLVGSAFMFLITLPVHAQSGPGGCVNSPENPTAVLAVVGSAGAFFFSRRRK